MTPSHELRAKPISTNSYRERGGSRLLMACTREISILSETQYFQIENSYFKQGLAGSLPRIYLRSAVKKLLIAALEKLGAGYQFIIYDGFRSQTCQKAIFDVYFERFLPACNYDHAATLAKTRTMVPHPADHDDHSVLPHNSGGAIDLNLAYQGNALDMGSDFDDHSELARTEFFEAAFDTRFGITAERWELIRDNRRLLFNSLISLGFTNHPLEWWHYNFGNDPWADGRRTEPLFTSAEDKVMHSEALLPI